MSRDDTHFRLRLPEEEKAFIREQASRNLRSMTAEIIFTIRDRMQQMKSRTAGEPLKTAPTA
ncbi:MAG: Arc family DNA-binding protein [Aurantimonas endophytica]|uniref:Arc family DNA-binding protein n=1 Tax=Aurantimonas endophytica TaxID=1522175 RepID=UPI0030029915